ncbi:MAG: hypothetical protein ACYDHZ_00670 [Dehalococcoidia bacterium]
MPVNLMKSGISVGVGVIDEVLERGDTKAGRTAFFKKYTDIERIALAGIGYGLQVFMPRYASMGEALALSSTPLLVKSIAGVVAKTTTTASADFTYRRRAPAGMGNLSNVGQTTKPEFDNARVF